MSENAMKELIKESIKLFFRIIVLIIVISGLVYMIIR